MNASVNKEQQRIRRMFSQIAPRYDLMNHVLSLNIDRVWRRWTTELAPVQDPEAGPMLDLCTGTGDLALAYDRAARGQLKIVAADFCHEMLVRAKHKADALNRAGTIHVVEADGLQLPFADAQFQLVTVSFGLRNMESTERGLAEMVRVTKPGGRVAILEFSRPRGRVLGPLYRWYFSKVLPALGQIVARNQESAYRYLPQSVMAFPDYEALAELMTRQGLIEVTFTPFTFGIATLYVGKKPAGPVLA